MARVPDGVGEVRSGPLDRRVTIQRATVTVDDFGGETTAWSDVATVWGSKTDVPDGERWRAAEVAATITTRFQIRWSADVSSVSPKDRLYCEGRTYDISHIKELPRRVGLEITARARAE